MRCDNTGHVRANCFAKQKKDGTPLPPLKDVPNKDSVRAIKEPSSAEEKAPAIKVRFCAAVTNGQPSVEADVYLNGIRSPAMFDTGCYSSMVSLDEAKRLGLEIEPDAQTGFQTVDSRLMKCHGVARANFSLRIGSVEKASQTTFYVISGLTNPIIIGLQLMGWYKLTIDCADLKISFADHNEIENDLSVGSGIRLAEKTVIPARSQTVVGTTVAGVVGPLLTIPVQTRPEIIVANSIDAAQAGRSRGLLLNLATEDVELPAGMQIGLFEVITSDEANTGQVERVGALLQIAETGEFVRVGDTLDDDQVRELSKLITHHIEAFSVGGPIGLTNLVEHKIEILPGTKPFAEPLRRRPELHKAETRRQVEEMLREGIIERSDSPWAAAYVLAKKKNGELRLCIDFRRLNSVTKRTSYPLPNMEDCLEPHCGNRFSSQLDLASGFWQIPMEEKSKELTSFRTEDGNFHFNRMPFGLTNAPASFQRMVNALFSNLKGINLQVFIDDICVATKTWRDHLTLLAQVFELLISANLKLKGNKCLFGSERVTFLGHELSAQGIQQDPSKLKSLLELPEPTSNAEVKRFLGMCSYYRRFVPSFAILAEPLTRLTRKNVPYEWNLEQQQAFRNILSALGKNATLANFSHNLPTTLKTDACKQGLAGILLQQKDDIWHMVSCCSRRISKTEENYGISELEGLAIVYCVTKFRPYLLGKHFTILTDHCALCALKHKMPNSPKLRRWALILSEFDFDIVYVKGGLHQDADCLSRAPVDDSTDPYLEDKVFSALELSRAIREEVVARVVPTNPSNFARDSEQDDEGKEHYAKARQRKKGYKIFQGLLYYEDRLFVPMKHRKDLITECHSDASAGHGGIRATVDRLKEYWWPKMSEDVHAFVASCTVCQARKTPRERQSGEMNSFSSTQPMELVAFDCLGPLPASIRNKQHVIVGIVHFTCFVDAKAVGNIQGLTFARFLEQFMSRFGVPKVILTDNANTFCNQSVERLRAMFKFGLL